MSIDNLKPNYGYTILKPIESAKMHGNIVIPDMGKEKATIGEIVKFQKTYNFNSDTEVDFLYDIGDHVVYSAMGGKKIKIDMKEYIVVSNNDILTKI